MQKPEEFYRFYHDKMICPNVTPNAAHLKLAELEASYKKQAKASVAGADANVVRIQIALESFKRDLTTVSGILGKMKAEGGEQAQKADKLQANVEKILGALIAEAGWTV